MVRLCSCKSFNACLAVRNDGVRISRRGEAGVTGVTCWDLRGDGRMGRYYRFPFEVDFPQQ
eukprot:766772-Hanusia_phi.AAC.6